MGHKRHPPFATSFAVRNALACALSYSPANNDIDKRLGHKRWEEKQTTKNKNEDKANLNAMTWNRRQTTRESNKSWRVEHKKRTLHSLNRKTCEWIAYKKKIHRHPYNSRIHQRPHTLSPILVHTQTASLVQHSHSFIRAHVLIGSVITHTNHKNNNSNNNSSKHNGCKCGK